MEYREDYRAELYDFLALCAPDDEHGVPYVCTLKNLMMTLNPPKNKQNLRIVENVDYSFALVLERDDVDQAVTLLTDLLLLLHEYSIGHHLGNDCVDDLKFFLFWPPIDQ